VDNLVLWIGIRVIFPQCMQYMITLLPRQRTRQPVLLIRYELQTRQILFLKYFSIRTLYRIPILRASVTYLRAREWFWLCKISRSAKFNNVLIRTFAISTISLVRLPVRPRCFILLFLKCPLPLILSSEPDAAVIAFIHL
jgi:hypothetical protein